MPDAGEHTYISYADFGRQFFASAVTRERVAAAAAGLAGRPIEVGPLPVGPLGLVKVRAKGSVGTPLVERAAGDEVAFDVVIPATVHLTIEIGPDRNRFAAAVRIRLAVTARAAEPLLIVIDISTPTKADVEVDVKADGLRASVLQTVAGVNSELRRTVASFVRREIERPQVQKLCVIDVARAVDSVRLPG